MVEGTHEPLVYKKDFAIVQGKLRSRQRPGQSGEPSMFAGLLKCGECGKSLTIRYTNAKHPQQIYSCKTYNAFGFWSDGYFACSIGEVSSATIQKYIESQG